jgi:hypothetical protein
MQVHRKHRKRKLSAQNAQNEGEYDFLMVNFGKKSKKQGFFLRRYYFFC